MADAPDLHYDHQVMLDLLTEEVEQLRRTNRLLQAVIITERNRPAVAQLEPPPWGPDDPTPATLGPGPEGPPDGPGH